MARGEKYDPLNPDNLGEALANANLGKLASYINGLKWEKAVNEIVEISEFYWIEKARKEIQI